MYGDSKSLREDCDETGGGGDLLRLWHTAAIGCGGGGVGKASAKVLLSALPATELADYGIAVGVCCL